jgi:putative membrane protein
MMATGMVLDGDKFSNIDVSKGKVIADGNNNIVIGAGFPGLSESLNVKVGDKTVDLDLPESFDVTADVKDFKLDMTMTVATSALFEDINTDDLDTDELFGKIDDKLDTFSNGVSDLAKGIKKYTDGVTKIKAGSTKLAAGTSQLKTKAGSLSSGVGKLQKGSGQLKAGFEGKEGALAASSGLSTGLKEANTKLSQFSIPTASVPATTPQQQLAIANKAKTEANAVLAQYKAAVLSDTNMQHLKAAVGDANFDIIFNAAFVTGYQVGYGSGMKAGAQQAVTTINTTIAALAPQMTQLKAGIQSAATVSALLDAGLKKMYTGATKLNTGLTTLNKSVPALITGVGELNTGAQKIDKYLGQLKAKNGDLVDGSNKLNDGTKTLVTKVTDMEGDAKTLANRITSLVNAGKNYNTFTGIKSGKSGSVKFVIKTEAIEKK